MRMILTRVVLILCVMATLTAGMVQTPRCPAKGLYGDIITVSERPEIPVTITTRSAKSQRTPCTLLFIKNKGSTPVYLDLDTAFWDSPENYTVVHPDSGLPRPLTARYKLVNETAFHYEHTGAYATPPKPAPTPAGKYVHAWQPVVESRANRTPAGSVAIQATQFKLPGVPGDVNDEGVVAAELPDINRSYEFTYDLWFNGSNHTVSGTVQYGVSEERIRQLPPPSDPAGYQGLSWWELLVQSLADLLDKL